MCAVGLGKRVGVAGFFKWSLAWARAVGRQTLSLLQAISVRIVRPCMTAITVFLAAGVRGRTPGCAGRAGKEGGARLLPVSTC